MAKIITLREANQGFARCVREVEAGAEFVITRNGVPVARLMPVGAQRLLNAEQQAARIRAKARMTTGWPINAGKLDRAALHER